MIEYALPGDATMAPPGLASVLELLDQLLSGRGGALQNKETEIFLQSMPPGGKTGKLIKNLLRRQ